MRSIARLAWRVCIWRRLGALACLAGVSACQPSAPSADAAGAADLVLKNGRIYTVDASRAWATSVAIRDGRITAVGKDADTARLVGAQTKVVDLHGKLVLPAFHDAHAHPVWGGLSYSQCPLYEGNTPAEYQQLIAKCVAGQPGSDWVYGVGWRDGVFTPEGVPDKKLLDAVAPDRPVAFMSVGGHSIWLNSRALQVAGITKDTPDPPNGRIDRDAKGEPVGALQESAVDLISAILPPPSTKAREDALRYGLDYFNALGIVGWQDANVSISSEDPAQVIQTYASLRDKGELKAHVAIALTWDNARGAEQLADLLAASERLQGLGLEAKTVKFFLDGVLAQRTAALIEPYSDQPGLRGDLQVPLDVFNEAILQLDARGFQVHVHAIGDRAIRASLDAFAKARERNGKKDNRHLVSHANLIKREDWARFAELGVVGVFQPLWARLDDYMRMTGVRVGPDRMAFMYPAGSLMRAGAKVAYGSDWSVASANPLEGIEVALTRRDPGATQAEQLAPDERVTLEQAIRSYTLNSAYAIHKDNVTGSIETGKSADLVVLDRDLFRIPVNEIAKTQVLLTLFAGDAVHGDIPALSPSQSQSE